MNKYEQSLRLKLAVMSYVKVGEVIIPFSKSPLLGQYVFIETSLPRQLGDNAYLLSQPFDPAPSGRCLKFWHHMKGASIGTLNVYLHTGNFSAMQLLWQRKGNKGNIWMLGQTPITSSVKYQVLMMSTLTIIMMTMRLTMMLATLTLKGMVTRDDNLEDELCIHRIPRCMVHGLWPCLSKYPCQLL